jgi:hypothetical protein
MMGKCIADPLDPYSPYSPIPPPNEVQPKPSPIVVRIGSASTPALTEEDVRRIIREELSRAMRP